MHSYNMEVIFLPHRMTEIRAWERDVPFSEGGRRERRVHGSEKQQEGEAGPSKPTGAPSKTRTTEGG